MFLDLLRRPLPGNLAAHLPRRPLPRHLLLAAAGLVVIWILTSQVGSYNDYQIAQVGAFAVAIAGLTFLSGLNGQISLGHGGLMMVGAYATALIATHSGLSFPIVLIAATAGTAAFGGVVGVGAARLRGPYLAGATLGLALALPAIPVRWPGPLGGRSGVAVTTPVPPSWLAGGTEQWMALISAVGLLIAFVLLANLRAGSVGRTMRAVRDNEVASSLAGISVARTQVLAFVVSAACAGLGGGLLAYTTNIVAPDGFPLTLSITLLAVAVIGGLGSLAGAVAGGVLIVYLPQWATSTSGALGLPTPVAANLADGLFGAVLIAVILFSPGGLRGGVQGVARRLARGLRRRSDQRAPQAASRAADPLRTAACAAEPSVAYPPHTPPNTTKEHQ